MPPLSVLKLELSLYTHGPLLVCLMIFQLSVPKLLDRLHLRPMIAGTVPRRGTRSLRRSLSALFFNTTFA